MIKENKNIVISGLRRSGSTWVYNIVRIAISLKYNEITAGYGKKFCQGNKKSVIKLHEFCAECLENKPIVISSIRDPRDMAASAIRRGICTDPVTFLSQEKINYEKWKKYINLQIRYEDIVKDKIKEANKILKKIKINVNAQTVVEVVDRIKPEDRHNKVTQLWPNHITNGDIYTYFDDLNKNQIENIQILFGEWIEKCGYSNHEHIFIAAPNSSGSSLLYSVLSTSPNVSTITQSKINRIAEGFSQGIVDGSIAPIPTKKEKGIFSKGCEKYQDKKNYNWKKIKKLWYNNWNLEKHILLEKTPTNIYRLDILKEQFPFTKFILMIRNPYCACESIRRRNNVTLKCAAEHWANTAKQQLINKKQKKSFFLKYEDLCDNFEEIEKQLLNFANFQLFDISKVETNIGKKRENINNCNYESFKKLSQLDINEINSVLKKEMFILNELNYNYIEYLK
jgi:hypothetical protein